MAEPPSLNGDSEEQEPQYAQPSPHSANRMRGTGAAAAVGAAITAAAALLFHRYLFHYVDFIGGRWENASFESDFPTHIAFMQSGAAGNGWRPHFLYDWLVYALTLGSTSASTLGVSSVVVLSVAIAARYALSYWVIESRSKRAMRSIVLASALMFAAPLPNWWRPTQIYIGQLSPAVWHNPTTVFVMPLAMALLYASLRAVEEDRVRWLAPTSVLMLLNVAAKPNFAMAFLPVWTVAAVVTGLRSKVDPRGLGRMTLSITATVAPALALLAWQYLSTFSGGGPEGSVTIAPLLVWRHFSPSPLASLALSVGFPVAFAAAYPAEVRRDRHIVVAWVTLAVATAMFAVLAQTGITTFYGNFAWGPHVGLAVLFLASGASFAHVARRDWRSVLVSTVLAAQTITGLWYFARLLSGALYY